MKLSVSSIVNDCIHSVKHYQKVNKIDKKIWMFLN